MMPGDRKAPEYKWCPNCGPNADVIVWDTKIGQRYLCHCGLSGRFGDGTSAPSSFKELTNQKEE